MVEHFKALVVEKTGNNFSLSIKNIALTDLPDADILIRVAYSGINYKDSLASIPNGNIISSYPMIPGIDLAGVVISSQDPRFHEGDEVIATSYDIGVTHCGGYSEYVRIPGDWIVPLPKNLSLKEAMVLGTAGFTAALSIQRLEDNDLNPDSGKILVSGATGGVGSLAISMLSKLGYHIVASTGKASEHNFLYKIGAKEIISREDVSSGQFLDTKQWAGAIDPVGGTTLASILSKLDYKGSVAVCGLTGGIEVPTSVLPFILRGVNLLGIDSVYCPMGLRKTIWHRLASDLKPYHLADFIQKEISLEELPETLPNLLKGQAKGRFIVDFNK